MVDQPPELPTQPPPIPPREVRKPAPEEDLQPQLLQQPPQPQPQLQQQQLMPQQLQFVDTADVESEPSISIDISEELRRVAGELWLEH